MPKNIRTIYTYDSTNANGTSSKSFTYANLLGQEQAYFNTTNISTAPVTSGLTGLSQFLGTTSDRHQPDAAGKTAAARNQSGGLPACGAHYEGAGNDNSKYYRQPHPSLGDIVDARGAYVKRRCSVMRTKAMAPQGGPPTRQPLSMRRKRRHAACLYTNAGWRRWQ